jgi:hypothetical protein
MLTNWFLDWTNYIKAASEFAPTPTSSQIKLLLGEDYVCNNFKDSINYLMEV